FAVTFYLDDGSGLPGTQVYTASGLAVTGNPDYVITLTTPAVLTEGTYWVSAVGTITLGNWYWEGRSITNNTFATAWRNPLGGYGLGCTDWARLQDCLGFSWPDQMFRIVGTTGGGTPTPTPTASPTCTPGTFQVLIVYSNQGVQPVTLHDQIAAEPGVTTADYFDAQFTTPTLAQLLPYNIVVAFSNSTYFDPTGMGNVLADYADAGGIVAAFDFDWFGPPFGLEGRWQTGGYSPFVEGGPTNFTNSCLGTFNMSHPLMQGIPAGSLCAFFRHTLTLSAGAVSVAEYQDLEHLCAYQVNNGHTGVGINAYVGDYADSWSGPFGTVVVNAGR